MDKQILYKDLLFLGYLLVPATLIYDGVANNISIIFTLAIYLFSGSLKSKFSSLKRKTLYSLYASFFLLSAVGLLYSSNLNEGFSSLEKILSIVIFPAVFSSSVLSKKQFHAILKVFVASCFLACMICLVFAAYKNYLEGYTLISIYDGFFSEKVPYRYQYLNYWYFTYTFLVIPIGIQAMYFSFFIGFALIVSIYFRWFGEDIGNLEKKLLTIILILFCPVIMLLSIRIVLFGLLLILCIFLIYIVFVKKQIILPLKIVLVVGLTAIVFIFLNPVTTERLKESLNFYNRDFKKDNWGGRSFRIEIWGNAFQVIKDNPFLGVGIGDSQELLDEQYLKNNFPEGINYNTHNQFIDTALELGMVGLFLLMFVIVIPFRLSLNNNSSLYVFFLTLTCIYFLTENVLSRQYGIVFYSFFNSLFTCYYFYSPSRIQYHNNPTHV